jgi:cytochrome c-type biogenesis protein
MDIDALKTTLEQANLASIAIGFAAGFLFSFNPVALASIPVSLAYVTKAHETRRAVLYGAMFIVGMIVTQMFLGLIAGLSGAGSNPCSGGNGAWFWDPCSSFWDWYGPVG